MVAFSGIKDSPKPAMSGDVRLIAPAHCYGHQHYQQRSVFFAIINLLSCITLAKQSCYGKHELNTIYTTTYYHV
jgi:hypothetical protein